MGKLSSYVGLDVHKDAIAVAVADEGKRGEVREPGKIASTPAALTKLVSRLARAVRALRSCYEAGPCGCGIQRQLSAAGHERVVVAPSLIPLKAGDRVKTGRRDAINLARLHCAGDLTPAWTLLHRRWLADLRFEQPAPCLVPEDCIAVIEAATARRGRWEAHAKAALADWPPGPVVRALQALRGMALVAAATGVAELGDVTRFADPRQLMAYLGLVPSEHSSGRKRRQGGITKAGNGAARRMLTEAAWTENTDSRA